MDFSKSVRIKDKVEVSKAIKTMYIDNKWFANVNGKHIKIHSSSTTIVGQTRLFSLIDNWRETNIAEPVNLLRVDAVRQYWARYKPGMTIHGTVKKGEFHVSKLD